MRPKNRLWTQWWFWLVIVLIAMTLAWVIGARRDAQWGQQYSANLFADALVALAVSILVVQWWERRERAGERAETRRRVLEILLSEAEEVQIQAKTWIGNLRNQGWIPSNPLPTGAWSSISSGPLLDAIPMGLAPMLLRVYETIESANVLLPYLFDLCFGTSSALLKAKDQQFIIRERMRSRCEFLLTQLDAAIPDLSAHASPE